MFSAGFAAFGLALLLHKKDGPSGIFVYIRDLHPSLSCLLCTVVLFSLVFGLLYFAIPQVVEVIAAIGVSLGFLALIGEANYD